MIKRNGNEDDNKLTELLKHIRVSKFVGVDLTCQNNSVHFEEGNAMGLDPSLNYIEEDTQFHERLSDV